MKADYQKAFNIAEDLKKDVPRTGVLFSDAIFRADFARWLFDYLDERVTKEEFKEFLKGRLLLTELSQNHYAKTEFLSAGCETPAGDTPGQIIP